MCKLRHVHLRHLQYAWRHDVQGLPGKGVGRAADGRGLAFRPFVPSDFVG